MQSELEQITLEGDENSFTKRVIRQKKDFKIASKTIALPEPNLEDISHLISDKPLRFSQRRFLG